MTNSTETSLTDFSDPTTGIDGPHEDEVISNGLEGRDHNGWKWHPTPGIAGILAMWITDTAGLHLSESHSVAICPAYGSKVRNKEKGIRGGTWVRSTHIHGYKIVHGTSRDDPKEIVRVMGEPGQTPREVSEAHYDGVVEKAVEWLQNNDPTQFHQ